MAVKSALQQEPTCDAASSLDARRRAPWLLNDYTAPTWTVSDSRDISRTANINFQIPLADGRPLIEVADLCATVKEYAWWVRDPRYSRIDDAATHASLVRNLVLLTHALTLRDIWSFEHIVPYDIEQLVEDCRYGADAVLRATERVDAYLKRIAAANAIDPQRYGGLPRYTIPATGKITSAVHATAIVTACNLPASASAYSGVAVLVARAARANGLQSSNIPDGEPPPLPNQTAQALQRWLDPLEQLYTMRRQIEADAIWFKPFPRGAARVAAVKGIGVARTPIPPPKLVLHLLDRSARWIFDQEKILSVGSAKRGQILHMATACWIVIAAFTARRDEEIDAIQDGCLRGDDASGWWLHVYIEKTLQRKEWIPVPGLVARAVEMMAAISADARNASGTTELFQWQGKDGKVIRLDVGRHLDDFAKLVGVPQHKVRDQPAASWHWHPHQFRRFFAVLYFYRFEGATIETLSHHLRHFSLEMTRRYVTMDPDVAALWTDVEWGYMGHVARSIVAGERSISGAMGERLKKTARRLVDVFRRKIQVVSPDRVGASLTIVMQRQGLTLSPKPWVTCSCPMTRDAAEKAVCRRGRQKEAGAVGADFAHAGPLACSICPYSIIEGSRVSFVDAEISHLEEAITSGPRAGTVMAALEQARVAELREVKDSCYGTASSLSGIGLQEEEGR